jgi:hypothetical protein
MDTPSNPPGPPPAEPPPPGPRRSIHYRRRWAYALWVTLLLLSLGALARWEQPRTVVAASLQVKVRIRQAPPGAVLRAWAGPWDRWTGPERLAATPIQVPLQPDGSATLPVFHLPIARRRWVRDYIPRGTWDLMVLGFTAPGQPPRYTVLPLCREIRLGVLRPRWRLTTSIECAWTTLAPEVRLPDPKP